MGGLGGVGGGVGWGVRVDVNEELKFFAKIRKKIGGGGGRGWVRQGGWMGGQGGCERRIEIFVKIQKKKLGGGSGSGWGGGSGGGSAWSGGESGWM